MEYPGFCGAAYTIQNISANCQRAVNLYPQPDESRVGKNSAYLLSTPGLNRVADLTSIADGGVRGTYTASNERFFVVAAGVLVELGSTWNILGTYALPSETGLTPVTMTDNGQDMMIATGPNGYWFNFATNTLTQITDAVFFGAVGCGFIDGFVVFNQPGTQIFWKTNLYSTVIDPLGFASAEGNPDNLITLLCDHREIWLFGNTSTEVWYDSGGANFPFSFIQGAYISHGIVAPYSAVRLDNTTFWLGNDEFGSGIAYRANGYAPVRISTFAMEQAWQKYPTIADAVAWTYQQDGHSFYVLNFPSGDATWVYDAATGLWHERAYLGTLDFNDGALHRGRPNAHSFAFGRHIVGDWQTGYLYELAPQFKDDDGREIVRLRSAPYIDNELKRVIYSQFQLDMEVGSPAAIVVGSAPTIALSTPRGSNLPDDAVIVGIYPVMDGGATVAGGFQNFTFTPADVGPTPGFFYLPPPALPSISTGFGLKYGNSLGTDLALLSLARMMMTNGASIFDDYDPPLTTQALSLGFAVYYTSATPTIDPQIAPPFAVPPGQGLAWALPFTASGSSTSYFGAGDAEPATGTGPYTNAFGLTEINLSRPLGATSITVGWWDFSIPVPPTWTDPGNILLDDDSFTTSGVAQSGFLNVSGFKFNVPNIVAVSGERVTIRGYSAADGVTLSVQPLINGIPTGQIKTIAMPTVLSTLDLGSVSDLWGNNLTTAIVNASNFGIQITVNSATDILTYLTSATITLGLVLIAEPLINLRRSDDGGYTWSPYNAIGMGNVGEYRKRIIWRRLGNSRQRVYEVSTGQNYVGLSLYNAYLELQAANS